LPIVQENLSEIGIDTELKPVEFTSQVGNNFRDSRTHHMSLWYHNPTPIRLDPNEMTRRFAADWAGADGNSNPTNYANCEHTTLAHQQNSIGVREERQEVINEAQGIMSNDFQYLPLVNVVDLGAVNNDVANWERFGTAGLTSNTIYPIYSTPTNGDALILPTSPVTLETTNFFTLDSYASIAVWSRLIHAPLMEYDENWQLTNGLAASMETSNEGKTITVELKDASFHNGDPITAEDVKFTFEWLGNNSGLFPKVYNPPYESIEVVDDKTTEFNFTDPYPIWTTTTVPLWGILHKETWEEAGALEDAGAAEPEANSLPGSGAFQISTFQPGQTLELTPANGHPKHQPDHDIIYQVYRNEQTKVQAFQAGEIDSAGAVSAGAFDQITSDMDSAQSVVTKAFTPFGLIPQYPRVPMKSVEMRHAIGAAINRQEINQVAFLGESEPELYASTLLPPHEWRPPEDQLGQMTDDPTGSPEQAIQLLEEAGWGFDSDGNLHYPPDYELEPLWPEGEQPSPDEFPCLNEEGEYVPEGER
jgi:peptide/nickel transport system substrate-binding protein